MVKDSKIWVQTYMSNLNKYIMLKKGSHKRIEQLWVQVMNYKTQ